MEKRKVVRKVRMMYLSTRPSQGRYGFFGSGSDARGSPSSSAGSSPSSVEGSGSVVEGSGSDAGGSGSVVERPPAEASLGSAVSCTSWSSSSEWGVVLIANAGRGALEAVVELAHHLVLPFGEVTLEDMLTSLANKAQVEGQIVDRSDLKA